MKEKNKGDIFYIGKGIVISILFTIILLGIFSIVLAKTDIPESTMTPVIITITALSIFIGGIICGKNISNKGIINGGLVGLIYMSILYIVSSLANGDFSLNLNSVILIASAILAGMIGGIIGVNFSNR